MSKTSKSIFDRRFVVGVILSLVSAVIVGIIHVGVLYVFGLPILSLIFGLILVWTSKSNAQIKSIMTLSFIFVIPSAFLISFQLSKAVPETFYIPQKLRGEFVLFLNEECGTAEEFENGRRVYRIPEHGVLVTRFKINDGYLDREFFLMEDDSGKERIPFFYRQKLETEKEDMAAQNPKKSEELNDKTLGVFWSYGSETYRISQQSASFIVSDFGYYLRDFQKDRFIESKHFVENAEKILNECRRSKQSVN